MRPFLRFLSDIWCIKEAVIARFPDFTNPIFDVYVASPGGSGTTMLLEYLSQFTTTNDVNDADGMKHCLAPPKECLAAMLYIYDDVDVVVSSIDRQGWLEVQTRKLGYVSIGPQWLKRWIFAGAVRAQIDNWKSEPSVLAIHG